MHTQGEGHLSDILFMIYINFRDQYTYDKSENKSILEYIRLVIICATERNGTQRNATKLQGGSLIAGYTTLNTKLLHTKKEHINI